MKKILKITMMVFCIIAACDHKGNDKCIIIDIEKTLHSDGPKDFILNDIAKSVTLIPIETNDSILLNHVIIEGVTEEYIVAHGGNIGVNKLAIYFINKTNGKVSSIIDRYGRGPGEYLRIGDVSLNKRDNTVYLSDYTKINEYTFEGKFINSIQNDSIGKVRILNDGNFAVSYHPSKNTEFALGIYDSSWNLLRRGIPKAERDRNFDMMYFDAIFEFNNEFFYKLAHSDTLFRIKSEYDESYLVHSKGRYQLPINIKASMEQTEREGDKFIQQDFGYLISKFYFLSYYYDNKLYQEIWNIDNSSLMYKSIYSREGGVNGVPVRIGEKSIYVWPTFVSNDAIYCIIQAEDAITLIPSLLEDSNPVILEIKLSTF